MNVVLSIAGSDSSGGAGVQADLKTFEAHGVFGATAITVLTAQNTTGVTDIHQIKPEFVAKQIETALDDFDVKAIKVGMLFSTEIIQAVHKTLLEFKKPIVLDPVFVSRANSLLLREDAIEALKDMFNIATLITPNMYEAYRLFEYGIGNSDSLQNIKQLTYPVLIKNHLTERNEQHYSVDILYNGENKTVFETPLSLNNSTHGTGCSYSAAITANLALGCTLCEAIDRAKRFVYFAIESAPQIGEGAGPIGHGKGYKKMKEYYGEEIWR